MRALLNYIILFTLLCCQNKSDEIKIPDFKSNSTKEEIWEPIQDIVRNKDFCVACLEGGGFIDPSYLKHRIFCLNDTVWQKIELRKDIIVLDTMYSEMDADFVSKQIILRKDCKEKEAKRFLTKLVELHLFELPEEKELLENCKAERSDHKVPEYTDNGSDIFYIIHGDKVRILNYQSFNRHIDCPSVEDWENVKKIKDLFENDWYAKIHY